jgi:hypothetical protein
VATGLPPVLLAKSLGQGSCGFSDSMLEVFINESDSLLRLDLDLYPQ